MPAKYKLLSQLRKSLALLEHRKFMIPRYVEQDEKWLGKNHYSMDMIPEIEFQIEEMKAAIAGIEELKRKRRVVCGDTDHGGKEVSDAD